MTTLEEVRAEGIRAIYPTEKLSGHETALILFAAAFMGRQDACWAEEAGLVGTCVDNDPGPLRRMQELYPDDWEFVDADAYEFASRTDRSWDVVSADCPTGYFDRAAAAVDMWCEIANHLVILGAGTDTPLTVPVGWTLTDRIRRSNYEGGVYWVVLERVVGATVYPPGTSALVAVEQSVEAEFPKPAGEPA